MYTINEEHINNVVKKVDYRLKEIWYNFKYTNILGCASYLYKKYGNPKTYQDFYNSYIKDHQSNSPEHGRDEEYLEYIAFQMRKADGNKESVSVYYDYMVRKLIIDTFNGSEMERKAKEMLKSSGYTITEPTYIEDTQLAIDFKANFKLNNYLIQVKPITFFMGDGNESLKKDRKLALEKKTKAEKQYNAKVLYMIYDKYTKEFLKHNGKYAFKLDKLINNDGTTKNIV